MEVGWRVESRTKIENLYILWLDQRAQNYVKNKYLYTFVANVAYDSYRKKSFN